MHRSRLSFDEAMTLWAARDVYRVHALFRGLVVVFFTLEFLLLSSRGYWYLGLVLISVQWGLLWCLRWALRWVFRWAHRGLWWCLDNTKVAVVTWLHARRR